MIFFCKGALETVKKLGWAPDVIHCHGWMSSLVPAYLKTTYKDDPTFKNSRVVYSIYENDFGGKMDADFAHKAVMGNMNEMHTEVYKPGSNSSLYAGAIHYSDGIVLAGENIDEEVLNNVKNSNKPVMEFESTVDFENYYNFYDEIADEELAHVV
jgi:starch synthase